MPILEMTRVLDGYKTPSIVPSYTLSIHPFIHSSDRQINKQTDHHLSEDSIHLIQRFITRLILYHKRLSPPPSSTSQSRSTCFSSTQRAYISLHTYIHPLSPNARLHFPSPFLYPNPCLLLQTDRQTDMDTYTHAYMSSTMPSTGGALPSIGSVAANFARTSSESGSGLGRHREDGLRWSNGSSLVSCEVKSLLDVFLIFYSLRIL